ncbi:MAG: hypothetical protein RML93_11650 [Anaerolineales bacterium]|nr:hypothetical protein [Anaerolineales bacterium]MDW8447929.1 hypothetical protein [Anaerolineales bacterium]
MDTEFWYGVAAYAAWKRYQNIQPTIAVIQNLAAEPQSDSP